MPSKSARLGALIGLVLLATTVVPATAQFRPTPFATWEPLPAPEQLSLNLAGSRPPNYGLAGGLIGGAVGAVLGGLTGHALCVRYSGTPGDSCVGGTAVGGLIGAALFGLIGYGFGREVEQHPAEQPDSSAASP